MRKLILQYNQQFTTITPLGFIAGYYDENLTIAYISEFFLHNLGYSYEEFMNRTSGSLKNVDLMEKTVLILKMIGFDISAVKAKCRCRRILSLSARGSNCGSYGV